MDAIGIENADTSNSYSDVDSRALIAGVIERAVDDVRGGEGDSACDAFLWIFGDQQEYGSLDFNCNMLDIPPETIRSKLRKEMGERKFFSLAEKAREYTFKEEKRGYVAEAIRHRAEMDKLLSMMAIAA